jgi:hypothetical protein
MFGSETLEVALDLAVLFSFMRLLACAFRETLEAWFKQRGCAILIDPGLDPTVRKVFDACFQIAHLPSCKPTATC